MILSPSDIPVYAPTVTLTGAALDGFLYRVQTLCESDLGADRPLELQSHREIIKVVSGYATFQIPYTPVISVELIEGRVRQYPGGTSAWYPIQDWTLDEEDSIINLVSLDQSSLNFQFLGVGGVNLNEIRVSFTAGFDFTSTIDPEVKKIKSVAGSLAMLLAKAEGLNATSVANASQIGDIVTPYGQTVGRVASWEATDFAKVQYAETAISKSFATGEGYNSQIENILRPLRKYLPLRWNF